MSYAGLESFFKELGEPAYRASQVFSWLHKGVQSFDEMTNLGKALREKLSERAFISKARVISRLESTDGTVKLLLELEDGECVETVLMQYEHGMSVCVSSQAGCKQGCTFCASAIGGYRRNLTPAELLDQLLEAGRASGRRVDNIVLMGIGEPLDNFDNVITFLYNINHEKGLNIGMRHISLSTCGLVEGIDRLAALKLPLTLSVSLHASDDETRSRLMPINRRYNIRTLLAACKRYLAATGRRISFEYALIEGQNDSLEHALSLARLLKGMLCHVNLIPVNPVKGRGYRSTRGDRIAEFTGVLERNGITSTVRRRLGSDIDAACGQLRSDRQQVAGGQ